MVVVLEAETRKRDEEAGFITIASSTLVRDWEEMKIASVSVQREKRVWFFGSYHFKNLTVMCYMGFLLSSCNSAFLTHKLRH